MLSSESVRASTRLSRFRIPSLSGEMPRSEAETASSGPPKKMFRLPNAAIPARLNPPIFRKSQRFLPSLDPGFAFGILRLSFPTVPLRVCEGGYAVVLADATA